MSDLVHLSLCTASEIGQALARGEASPVALVEYLLEKIETQNEASIFIRITRDRALKEARASEKRLQAGAPLSLLDGVPIAFKDLIDMQGEITSAGSAVYRDGTPKQVDAPIVLNTSAAGMVTLGKLNLTEFAFSGLGLNPHFGTPKNPHSPIVARVPGGSSSGSGVAVASGLVPCAIGTDTGGSVRIPAAFNGLFGYKPSEGRIDKTGVFALSQTLDTPGPLARSVQDCILLDMVLRGHSTQHIKGSSIEGVRIIVPQTIVLDDLDRAVATNFENSLSRLANAGAKIERQPFDIFSRCAELTVRYGTIAAAEAYEEHRSLVESDDVSRVDRRVVARILGGKTMSVSDLEFLHAERARLIGELDMLVGDALIAMPTIAMTAPEIAPLEADDDLFHRTNIKALRNTSLGNFLDLAGLALPNGVDADNLPTSLLICAPRGMDDRLLAYGLEVEKILGNMI